jgi:hypothetical protein
MRHVHHLFHSLQSLPSSQHPQRLPSLGYPSIYFLLGKLVKHFLPDASKLSSMAVPYLLSFGWGQNTSHKKWYNEARFRLQLSKKKIPYLCFMRLVLGALGLAAWLAAQNVGIGTAIPTERLHVEGNLRLQGAFMPNNLPGQPGNLLLSRGAGTPPVWLANGNARDVLLINPLTGEPAWFPNAVCSNPTLNRLTKVTSTGGAQPQICETHWSEAVGPLNYPVLWNTDATNTPNLYAGDDFTARLEVYATQESGAAIAGFANSNPGSHGGVTGIIAGAAGPQNGFPIGLLATTGGAAWNSYGVFAGAGIQLAHYAIMPLVCVEKP